MTYYAYNAIYTQGKKKRTTYFFKVFARKTQFLELTQITQPERNK